MKRRAISFITVLALCLSLCPMRALAAYDVDKVFTLTEDMTDSVTYDVAIPLLLDTHGYSYTISDNTAVRVKSTGKLYLTTGKIVSTGGAGIEVQAGGRLYVDKPDMTVIGTTYGLDIASDATVELSGGTFIGGEAAIHAADYRALLVPGYAYFDENDAPIPLTDVAGKTTVVVKACTDHVYSCTPNTGAPTHDGICDYCGTEVEAVPCTFFRFDKDGHAECADCGHTLDVTVNPVEEEYDGTSKPSSAVSVTVRLDGSEELTKDTDYTVECAAIVDVGETTITVTNAAIVADEAYSWTCTMTFSVTQAHPEITWANTDPVTVDYDGSPADASDLPEVTITPVYNGDMEELRSLLYFSYKEAAADDDSYIENCLPTDAGTYKVKASLPETTNYTAAESDPITLTIKPIDPIKAPPAANTLTYDRSAQELVTPGTLDPRAVGAVILYALGETVTDSDYSEAIPTATNAGTYFVWYKVEGTGNYAGVPETMIEVTIRRKPIEPEVKLSYYTCVYDGGYKQPAVTVIDPEDGTVLPDSEYQVTYWDNRAAGTALVIVSDKTGGNYAITPPEDQEIAPPVDSGVSEGVVVTFEITPADQAALTITNIPNTVTYGDVFTLAAAGGSGNGTVTWEITAAKNGFGTDVTGDQNKVDEIATIDPASGQVKVTGVGTVTVRATRSDADSDANHKDATAEWTFTAGKRSVIATVAAEDKTYDGNGIAAVHAVVEQGTAFDDVITITEVTGTFRDGPDAGTGKTVTVNTDNAVITLTTPKGNETITNQSTAKNERYTVIFSAAAVTADINKAAVTATTKTPAELTYNRSPQSLLSNGDVAGATDVLPTTANLKIEYARSKDGPWSEDIPQATDAGSYEVWYRVKESGNYLGTAAEKVVVTIKPKTVSNPTIALSQSSYVYDGSEKKPAVTAVTDGDDTIPSSEYTVTYSNNVNVGEATVTVTDNAGGNYVVNATAKFTITKGQAVLTGTPRANDLTYNGQPQDLVSVGTAAGGSLEYALKEGSAGPAEDDYKDEIPKGTNAGTYTVYYRVKGDSNHNGVATPSVVYVTIQPKTVSSPVIQFAGKTEGEYLNTYSVEYDESPQTPSVIVKDGSDTIPGPGEDGAEYTVSYSDNINAGTATVHIINSNGGNYIVNGSKTFTITKAKAGFAAGKEPAVRTLTYNGEAQQLVTPGEPVGGTAVYSLNGGAYSAEIPTGTVCGTSYSVKAKVLGDKNHENSDEVGPITVTIGKKTVTDPDIELSATKFRYNGSEQKPAVTVKDEKGNVIPANEYKVTYDGDTVNVGDYTVRIESRNINYLFSKKADGGTEEPNAVFEATVTIVPADQETLTITGKPSVVYYGDTIQLSTQGGSGSGTVVWSIVEGEAEGLIKAGLSEGQFVITGVGDITIKAARTPAAGSGYAAAEDTWKFHAYEKPVTAVVTAKDKVYNGDTDAELTITVPGTALKVTAGVTGAFDKADVGTDRTVIITVDPDPSKVKVEGANSDKYAISFPAAAAASITPATPTVTGVEANPYLEEYTGEPQTLVTAGSAKDIKGDAVGDVVYSLDGDSYGLSIPTGTDAGAYTVWYKVIAGGNYQDSAPELLKVTIDPKTVSAGDLTVTCSPEAFPYDGTQKTPYITVKDSDGNVIAADEYTVTFETASRTATGIYEFTITARPDGNYKFTGAVTGEFEIMEADQAPLSIVVSGSLTVFYGDTFHLSTVGGSGDGKVKWESSDTSVATIDPYTGVVTVEKGAGSFTVTAQKEGTAGGYAASNTDSVTFTAKPKQITPVVTVDDKNYDKTDTATVHVRWQNGDVLEKDSITVKSSTGGEPTGKFSSADVGTNKQVTLDVTFEGHEGKYEIILPSLITGSIYKVDAKLDPNKVPKAKENLVYDGSSLALLDAGDTEKGIGTVEYSLHEKDSYSSAIPTGTNAGTYTVWYRVAESVNWTGIGPVSVEVTIGKATPTISTIPTASPIDPGHSLNESDLTDGEAKFNEETVEGTFAWANGNIEPENGKSYDVIFTPNDTTNYKSVTITVQVTVNSVETEVPGGSGSTGGGTGSGSTGSSTSGTVPGGSTNTPPATQPGTEGASVQTSVRDGTASTVVNDAAGNELVDKAVADQSETVVIKPEIDGDVTKTEVSIPGSVINRLCNDTDAALIVSTPVADVTIPNTTLDMLSDAGDTVSIVTERVENMVVLTLTADGKEIRDIPGGLTLTISAENAGPGTVAVLVYEDGTRETVRRSVAGDGVVRIPLNGSVTVEVVDNSKEFADVSAESWAADAVAFASAHELFKGTSETTFSPEMTMSRAMLATVLYNLEGCPDQSLTDEFSDIDSDAWYAAGVSWAAANGITYGYGNGQFGPNDNVTREQLAVMLWRYVGNSAADEQVLNFTDADQASGYAMEALYWATANSILNGYGDGHLDPCGLTTRAQAAQLLKNFIEIT